MKGRNLRGVITLALVLPAACRSSPDPHREAIRHAAAWLWAQQGPDGGWHSSTYGLLRPGTALTPFVLGVLLRVPPDLHPRDPQAVARAVEFIRRCCDAPQPHPADYPTYAHALAVAALVRAGADPATHVSWLRAAQFSQAQGWPPDHPVHGAWGFAEPPAPPEPGRVDLSLTRYALEALDEAGVPPHDPLWERARRHLARLQVESGGFLFNRHDPALNKAGPQEPYGTATADGILALLACGVPEADDRVQRAFQWLRARHRPDRVPGFAGDDPWSQAMRYYYADAASCVLARLDPDGPWRSELAAALVRQRSPNGSWRNTNGWMKEDDPLIATTFALSALLRCLRTVAAPGP